MNNLSRADMDLAKRFIDRQLTVTEVEEINERIKSDKAFADVVAYHIAMKKAFAQREKGPHKEKEKMIPLSARKLKFWIPAAIFMGFLSIFGFLQFQKIQKTTICQIELNKLQKSIKPPTTLGGFTKVDKLIITGDFNTAIEGLIDLRNKSSDKCKNNLVNYKLGILLLYNDAGKQAKEAIEPLQCLKDYYPEKYKKVEIHLNRARKW